MHLLGAATPVATVSQIIGRISDHQTARLGSIGIRPDGALELTTSHLWIELGPLSREIRQGDFIPIELVFVRGRIHADAHVPRADGRWRDSTPRAIGSPSPRHTAVALRSTKDTQAGCLWHGIDPLAGYTASST